jgi:hypothetical protein
MTALTKSEGKPKNFALCECALPKREAEMEGQHKDRCSEKKGNFLWRYAVLGISLLYKL